MGERDGYIERDGHINRKKMDISMCTYIERGKVKVFKTFRGISDICALFVYL